LIVLRGEIFVPKHNVKSAALIVMTSIFLSRVLGFFREMLIARTFGRGMETDSPTALRPAK
jgi:peptidoglycan biosynthesis protein MviN/MurJ (putative lipid II flippase)